MSAQASENSSKIVERHDFTPTGFKWLGLSRITVRCRRSYFPMCSAMPVSRIGRGLPSDTAPCVLTCSGRGLTGGDTLHLPC